MSTLTAEYYCVALNSKPVGLLVARGDFVTFSFLDEYRDDPDRGVLGLRFEEDLAEVHSRSLLLPTWFSNLLPEGALREWIARDARVSPEREMRLLAHVGHDLPGAVRVFRTEEFASYEALQDEAGDYCEPSEVAADQEWRFSLAGVALKFSLLEQDGKFVAPATGEGGDWIVKLPDGRFSNVPSNEFSVMTLASELGLDIPECRLVHRDEIEGLPDRAWPGGEEFAYAVRRFDRTTERRSVHIEDMAQVLNKDVRDKYLGNYESIAAVIYRRGADEPGLVEFCRRLTLLVLLSSGDAHHKNWSLVYRDRRRPTLSPAYDLVATSPYYAQHERPDKLALKFLGTRRFENICRAQFDVLASRLDVPVGLLSEAVADLARRAGAVWEGLPVRKQLDRSIRVSIDSSIETRAATFLR